MPDHSIRTYRARRDFTVTAEPPPAEVARPAGSIFVVQKHAAHRAGLHWDFRLEHDGVLWSWAVPRGPSLDPADRRMAIHVEDHPIDYAAFQGTIPAGEYGGGTVETWDSGIWEPVDDPAAGMAKGHLHFNLHGTRLQGRFSLVRGRRRGKQDAWFLLKHEDGFARAGLGAPEIEQQAPSPRPRKGARPARGAVKGKLPTEQAPQLCDLAKAAPVEGGWLTEIKFDGYRILASIEDGTVRLLTRKGLDWAERMPRLAAGLGTFDVSQALIDGELVALRPDGVSSFPGLQAALKAGRDDTLVFYAFDLLHLDGWDLRGCALADRKVALRALGPWSAALRYSEHVDTPPAEMVVTAARLGLEGVICKRAGSRYHAGRGGDWLKVKCQGREEFVVLGWTPPAGSRKGFGSLHVGYHDPAGALHYAGGVGTGFDGKTLLAIRRRLDAIEAPPPRGLLVSGDPIDGAITWVRPELVAEVEYTGWSGAGRVRHAVFLGLREDKPAAEVMRPVADEAAPRVAFKARASTAKRFQPASPPLPAPAPMAAPKRPVAQAARIVTAKAPGHARIQVGGVEISHPDRELWPGITKLGLAEYWHTVAAHALPGLAGRPLSILRCPDGIEGETFFQKNGHGYLPHQVREGHCGGQPYLVIDDVDGLVAMAQMSAIELHAWGSSEPDPLHPNQLVFDLDPGEGVQFPEVVRAALDIRARLKAIRLESFCRTTGGKGLHVVVPLRPAAKAGWDMVKPFCRAFAETMAADAPDRYLAHLKIADRTGRILIDWLRNGLGSTAVASFCPRARPGAGVAAPLRWSEVTAKLDPGRFTLATMPARLARQKADPWAGFADTDQVLPDLKAPAAPKPAAAKPAAPRVPGTRIVTARKPKPR